MHHPHKFVLKQLLYLSPCIAQHFQEFVTDIEEIILRCVRASVISAGHVIIQKLELLVLAQQHGVALRKLLLYHHGLRDIRTRTDNSHSSIFRPDYFPFIQGPEPGTILFRHTVCCSVLRTRIIRANIMAHPLPVIRMNGIDHLSFNGRVKFLITFISHQTDHLIIGKIKRKSLLAVSPDHAARGHLGKYSGGCLSVLLCQLHKGCIVFRYIENSGKCSLGRFQHGLPLLLHGDITDRSVIKSVPILFLQEKHMDMHPDCLTVPLQTPDFALRSCY